MQPSPWQSSGMFTDPPLSNQCYMDGSFAPQNMPFASTPEYDNFMIKSDSPENLVDLGMMMTGDSGMDEQWMSFMRDSGLLDGSLSGSGMYGPPPP